MERIVALTLCAGGVVRSVPVTRDVAKLTAVPNVALTHAVVHEAVTTAF